MTNTARALAVLLLASAPAMAQPPPEVAAGLARIGRVVEVPQTEALYAPLHAARQAPGVRVERDAAYGGDPRNRLDVFAPEAEGQGRPVLVFVHGGGFTAGDKQRPGSFYYANIGQWAARRGMVGVNLTYRLAPGSTYPAAQQDIGAALAWVAANARRFGGDPGKVVLMGHSAGATHVAIFAGDPRFRTAGVAAPVAYVLVSGIYALGEEGDGPGERAYFGEDRPTRAGRSPREDLADVPEPVMVVHAELDPPRFVAQSEGLVAALRAAGRAPAFLALPGHSHLSEVFAIGTEDTSLTEPLAAFLRR